LFSTLSFRAFTSSSRSLNVLRIYIFKIHTHLCFINATEKHVEFHTCTGCLIIMISLRNRARTRQGQLAKGASSLILQIYFLYETLLSQIYPLYESLLLQMYLLYERRAVNRQPGFRSGGTYRRTCFGQDFFCFAASAVDLNALLFNPTSHVHSSR
jgi:hypothetical protein